MSLLVPGFEQSERIERPAEGSRVRETPGHGLEATAELEIVAAERPRGGAAAV